MDQAILDLAGSSNLIRPRRLAFLCSRPAELLFSVNEKTDILAARQKNMRPAKEDWLGTLRPACLNSLAIPPDLRVAVLAPHPDDFDAAGWKARLLRFHQSQQQRNLNTRNKGFDDRILGVNSQAAKELGIPAPCAEAFELQRW
jgi:hypothetical protein